MSSPADRRSVPDGGTASILERTASMQRMATAIGKGTAQPLNPRMSKAQRTITSWRNSVKGLGSYEPSPREISDRQALIDTWVLDEQAEQTSDVLRTDMLFKVQNIRTREAEKDDQLPWIRTTQADMIFAILILISALLTGIDVQISVQQPGPSRGVEILLLVLNALFLIAFAVELILHIRDAGLSYISPCNPAGCFDAAVLFIGVIEVILGIFGAESSATRASGAMRIFRLLRLLRMVRVLFISKELKMLMVGLMSSLCAVCWAMSLILVLMYLGALFCVILLMGGVWDFESPAIDAYFGSVWKALWTHFEVITLETWPDISDSVMKATGFSLWAGYFMMFISFTSISLLNLVTGIVCERLMGVGEVNDKDWQEYHGEEFNDKVKRFRKRLVHIFDDAELNRYGKLDSGDFNELMAREEVRDLLGEFDIMTGVSPLAAWEIIDAGGDEEITFNDFFNGLLRLRGSADRMHSLMIQRDLANSHAEQVHEVKVCEEKLKTQIAATMSRLEAQFAPTLESVEQHLSTAGRALSSRWDLIQEQEEHRAKTQKPYDVPATMWGQPVGNAAFEQTAAARLESLMQQLDRHCASAAELLTSKKSTPQLKRKVSVHTTSGIGVSQGAQTDSSIDFIEGLAGPGAHNRSLRSL